VSRPTRRFHVPSALRPSSLRVDPDRARALTGDGALLIDVRRQDDESSPLPSSVRIPPDEIPERVAGLQRDVAIVLACT
jgi:rhodanese-related sulfurtransferase